MSSARGSKGVIGSCDNPAGLQVLELGVTNDAATEISNGELLAAVDLGSNSFHLVVARYEHGTCA